MSSHCSRRQLAPPQRLVETTSPARRPLPRGREDRLADGSRYFFFLSLRDDFDDPDFDELDFDELDEDLLELEEEDVFFEEDEERDELDRLGVGLDVRLEDLLDEDLLDELRDEGREADERDLDEDGGGDGRADDERDVALDRDALEREPVDGARDLELRELEDDFDLAGDDFDGALRAGAEVRD